MDQLNKGLWGAWGLAVGGAALAASLLAGCAPAKTEVVRTESSTLTVTAPFAVPYLPRQELEIEGLPVASIAAASGAKAWDSAVVYSQALMSVAEKALFARLEPAGGEGLVAPSFTRDFDGDGKDETVAYGAFVRGSEQGNFVLVTRGGSGTREGSGTRAAAPTQVLLVEEFIQPPSITAFTLKPDKTLWFGGGIDAGEVIWKLEWKDGKPQLISLLGD
ncbi:MAG: hypothetical protein WCG80_10030 [Spirochaetales bacterium]